ncbi:MAG: dihydropteroate synthase [Gammaproteobacteria bacterium]|jgi:dihydropteroate synthase
MMELTCGKHRLELTSPVVMGILNITPDSFSDGGRYADHSTAIRHALAMVEAGAAIIDIGGESTRPGADPVTLQQELDRVIPVVERLAAEIPVPLSVDTSKPGVMREAIGAGAGIINDVMALREEGALEVLADSRDVAVCLMHMQGRPRSMQKNPVYGDVVSEVRAFLLERAQTCRSAGIDASRIVLDPGFGFGKLLEHNVALLKNIDLLAAGGYPVLAGVSRKSMIGQLLEDAPVERRLSGSVAAAVIAAMRGASILRVHDVRETADAMKIVKALL